MFAVIYQAYIKPESETEYQCAWHTVASYFKTHCGALGSSLHKTEAGTWLAYSRWPDKKTRDAAWPRDNAPANTFPEEIKHAIVAIKASIDATRTLPEIAMEVVEDLL